MLACQAPLPAADAPLGVVLQANLAHVKDSAITEGTTVYPGDELSTEVGGSLDLRIANSRFNLAANSRAHFYSGEKGSVVGTHQWHADIPKGCRDGRHRGSRFRRTDRA